VVHESCLIPLLERQLRFVHTLPQVRVNDKSMITAALQFVSKLLKFTNLLPDQQYQAGRWVVPDTAVHFGPIWPNLPLST
jgi:hypothetical protein